MDLHELFATAVDDLPPIPDQTPLAVESLRRRRVRARRSLLATACVLAVAAGSVTFAAPWQHGETAAAPIPVAAASSTTKPKPSPTVKTTPARPTQFQEDATTVLQSVWPVAGAHVVWEAPPGAPAGWPAKSLPTFVWSTFTVKAGGVTDTISITPRRWGLTSGESGMGNNPAPNHCAGPPLGFGSIDFSCTSATMKDGVTVLVLRSASTEGGPRGAEIDVWKGSDEIYLQIGPALAQGITDQQFIALAESSAYQGLFAEGEHFGLFAANTNEATGG